MDRRTCPPNLPKLKQKPGEKISSSNVVVLSGFGFIREMHAARVSFRFGSARTKRCARDFSVWSGTLLSPLFAMVQCNIKTRWKKFRAIKTKATKVNLRRGRWMAARPKVKTNELIVRKTTWRDGRPERKRMMVTNSGARLN